MAWPMVAMMAGTAIGMYGKKRTADKQAAYDSQIQEIMDKYKKEQHGIHSRDLNFENVLSDRINPFYDKQVAKAMLPAALVPNTDTQVAAIEDAAHSGIEMDPTTAGATSDSYAEAMADASGEISADIGSGGSGWAGAQGRTMGPDMQKLAAQVGTARMQGVEGMGMGINDVARFIARDRGRQITPGQLAANTQKNLDAVPGPKKHWGEAVGQLLSSGGSIYNNQRMYDAISKIG